MKKIGRKKTNSESVLLNLTLQNQYVHVYVK